MLNDVYAVGYRFAAMILVKNMPSALDFRFQRISGLGRRLETEPQMQGGDNVSSIHLPKHVAQDRLVLERGVTMITPLTLAFMDTMTNFKSQYLKIVVLLLNAQAAPICSWTCLDALPVSVRWGELDANSNTVLLNTLELECRNVLWLGAMA